MGSQTTEGRVKVSRTECYVRSTDNNTRKATTEKKKEELQISSAFTTRKTLFASYAAELQVQFFKKVQKLILLKFEYLWFD